VALGATAAQSLLGKSVTISRERGRFRPWGEAQLLITVHPSFILRVPDQAAKAQEYGRLVADLRVVTAAIEDGAPEPVQARLF
jgi:DNA polymerase